MFEVPGSNVKTVRITESCLKGLSQPEFVYNVEKSNDAKCEPITETCVKTRPELGSDEMCKLADSVKAFINYF